MEGVKKKMASLRKEAEDALQRAERSEDELRETTQHEEEVIIFFLPFHYVCYFYRLTLA